MNLDTSQAVIALVASAVAIPMGVLTYRHTTRNDKSVGTAAMISAVQGSSNDFIDQIQEERTFWRDNYREAVKERDDCLTKLADCQGTQKEKHG